MAHPDIATLEGIAREGRVQILRLLAHTGSGHPGGSLSVIDILTTLYFTACAVAKLLSEVMPTPLRRVAVTTFGESGDPGGLYAKHGLDAGGIARSVLKFLNR